MNESEVYWRKRFNELQNRVLKIRGLIEELRVEERLHIPGEDGIIEYFLTGDAEKIKIRLLKEAVLKNEFACPQCGKHTLSIVECIVCGWQIKGRRGDLL